MCMSNIGAPLYAVLMCGMSSVLIANRFTAFPGAITAWMMAAALFVALLLWRPAPAGPTAAATGGLAVMGSAGVMPLGTWRIAAVILAWLVVLPALGWGVARIAAGCRAWQRPFPATVTFGLAYFLAGAGSQYVLMASRPTEMQSLVLSSRWLALLLAANLCLTAGGLGWLLVHWRRDPLRYVAGAAVLVALGNALQAGDRVHLGEAALRPAGLLDVAASLLSMVGLLYLPAALARAVTHLQEAQRPATPRPEAA